MGALRAKSPVRTAFMTPASLRKWNENLSAFFFIAPFLIVFAVFLGYPVIYSFFISLHETTIYSNWYDKFSDMNWCGLKHYHELLTQDRVFMWSLAATALYAILTIPTSIAAALFLALILNPKLKGFSFYRGGFFLPNVFDMFVVGVIWLLLYNPNDGLIIRVLMNEGVKPVVHGLAVMAALALFWFGPPALAWLGIQARRLLGSPRLSSSCGIAGPCGTDNWCLVRRMIVADSLLLPVYISVLMGAVPRAPQALIGITAGAVIIFLILLRRSDADELPEMPTAPRWLALAFGGIFWLQLTGLLWNADPVALLIHKPLSGADALFREMQAGFLGSPILVLPSVALAVILKGCGFGMVLFLIAINGISPSVLEAAEIDGCTGFQRVRNVILPLVRPIILFMVITGLVGSLNAFTEIYAMTNNTGGPSMSFLGETVRAGRISGYHLYRTFDDGFYGRAAAISYILLLIALVISWLNFKILRTKED